ncbi:hypothetical protein NKH49_34175 [Mesorhizobium sp. M1088]|uniref:hypothetical protein n=1 Tax=Mesorhizobium sp. M1088 TaxID=2957056 RepID=UPI0033374CD2
MLDPDLARCERSCQPRTGAVQMLGTELDWQFALPKKMLCTLDARPANECHRNSTIPPTDRKICMDSVEKVRVAAVLKHFSIRHVEVKRFRACGFSGV